MKPRDQVNMRNSENSKKHKLLQEGNKLWRTQRRSGTNCAVWLSDLLAKPLDDHLV